MQDDADERSHGIPRKARVAVERQAIPHASEQVQATHPRRTTYLARPQQAVELFDLAALAFPSHPRAFGRVPLCVAVEQKEAVTALGSTPDATDGSREDRIRREVGFDSIRIVTEDGEVDVRIGDSPVLRPPVAPAGDGRRSPTPATSARSHGSMHTQGTFFEAYYCRGSRGHDEKRDRAVHERNDRFAERGERNAASQTRAVPLAPTAPPAHRRQTARAS